MCEVQEYGSLGVGGDKGESVAPGRLSVSSSGSDEDHKAPRDSLLGTNDEGPPGLPSEETSNSHKDSSAMETFEVPLVTSSKMEDESGDTGDIKMDEDEKEEGEDVKEKNIEEEDQVVEKIKCEEVEEEKELADEKQSESEAKEVLKEGVCDETERENQENERRDENKQKPKNTENTVKVKKVEITLQMEGEIKEEKTTDEEEAQEENRHGNEEQVASSPDSQKVGEEIKVEEEEEEKEEEKKKEKQEQIENKDGHGEKNRVEEVENKDKEKEKEKEETEDKVGEIPFRVKTTKDASTTRKVTKTVNFLDTELKKQLEDNLAKRNTINATSSLTSHSKSKEDEDEEHLTRLEGEAEEKTSRQWTLGEGNPVYRLSLKLSPNLFNTTDIPGANQHKEVDKSGFLTKLSGRSFPYIAQWKRRYCVLSKGRLYYYEREDSKAGDKSNGVIQLEYFDQVAEAGPKECKKATNVFIITSQDRSFFDPGRHIFSADTLPDMKDWIRRLQAALDQIRNNNRPAASTSPSASPAKDGKRRRDEAAEGKESKASQQNSSSKDRKKKKEESGRGRKSSRVGVSSQTQTSMVEPTTEVDGGRPSTVTPKGGVMLPGFSSRKDPQAIGKAVQRSEEGQEDLPQAGPTLTSITKQRVKGPQGRRAPQSRRMAAAAALKKRASSLSALEHQDTADNRSEGSDGATRSSRDSQTPEGDLKAETESEEENERKKLKTEPLDEKEEEIQDHTAERQFKIDNVDDGLFFKSGLKEGVIPKGGSEGEGQKNRRSGGLKVNFEETPASPAKNGTLGKFFRFSSKRKKYETKETLVPDHPDMVNNSRWTCVVL